MSKGNPEQPTAQAPRGHSSPNRVEVRGDGQQGPQSPGTPRPQSPGTPGLRDQPVGNGTQDRTPTATANNALASKVQGQGPTGPNGQSRESSGEQRATAPAGTGAARPGAAGGSPLSPRDCPRPAANRRRATERFPESSIHAAETRAGATDPAEAGAFAGVIADDSAEASALAAGSATTASAGRRPSCERFRPQRSRVLKLRRIQGLPLHSRLLVPYRCGIRRSFQQPGNPCGRASGLAGRAISLR